MVKWEKIDNLLLKVQIIRYIQMIFDPTHLGEEVGYVCQ